MTKEEINARAIEYVKKEREADKKEGYTISDISYSDLKYAFIKGAGWAQKELVHELLQEGGITCEELDKLAEELYPDNNPTINLVMKEMQNAYKAGYRKAMKGECL